jgi:hypothetical protein
MYATSQIRSSQNRVAIGRKFTATGISYEVQWNEKKWVVEIVKDSHWVDASRVSAVTVREPHNPTA